MVNNMKKLVCLTLILLLAVATVLGMAACDDGKPKTYEISVDMQSTSADTSNLKVRVYALDGTLLEEASLTDNKVQFELVADSYVATLAGLSEQESYSSILLTKKNRQATITVSESEYDEYIVEDYCFAFTVIMLGAKNVDELLTNVCNDVMCRGVGFFGSNVADVTISRGKYDVDVYDANNREIYHKSFTLDLDKRFYVIEL